MQANDEQNDGSLMLGFDDYDVKLGDFLRGERATRGKSLLDVQRDLRIKAAYIAAIENCDPDVFPNRGFVAGYVRSYARYLKLDPDLTFEAFCKESGFKGVSAELKPRRGSEKAPLSNATIDDDGSLSKGLVGLNAERTSSVWMSVSPSGLASVAVLGFLLFGVVFGGWKVLMDLQRVEFAPVEQTPAIASNVSPIVADDSLGTQVTDVAQVTPTRDPLRELYRPQELAVPKISPRDGPIVRIDPETVGALKPAAKPEPVQIALPTELPTTIELPEPIVTVEAIIPTTRIFATRPAWVRVYEDGGAVLFEAILEANNYYTIPIEAKAPMLRAGNSGSVFVVVNDEAFGPVGSGTSVAKRVSLAADTVKVEYVTAENLTLDAGIEFNTAAAQ